MVPVVSYLIWKLRDEKPLKVLIYDMTVPLNSYIEHNSFSWVLIHDKFAPIEQLTKSSLDYKGFFPQKDFKFVTNDFLKLSHQEVIQAADSLDMVYFTDTYGIYSKEWYGDNLKGERSKKIYGGLNKNDLILLKRLQDSRKLVLAEFNFLASPTALPIRKEAEKLLDVTWTGWVGRYYECLDTLINPDIPVWARSLYERQNHKPWDFHQAGILLVHEHEKIVVLEMDATLKEEAPWVYSSEYGEQKYGLPQEITYPYWFDILESGPSNRIISKFKIYANENGKKIMNEYGIPDVFPCVLENKQKNYYYFCGDFCDAPLYLESAKLAGVSFYHKIFYNRYNYIDRTPFFWHFFRPMITTILDDYWNELHIKGAQAKVAALYDSN
jgi:hypothetical protein